jgi:1-acyl-sn-glycerol-3-phosphate acyltransferase
MFGGKALEDVEEALRSVSQEPQPMSSSPFLDLEHPIGAYEATKLVLLAPVAFLRLLGIVICFLLIWIPSRVHVAMVGMKKKKKRKTMEAPSTDLDDLPDDDLATSRVVDWFVKPCARALLFFSGFLWISVKGRHHMKRNATILVFNHITFADPVMLLALLGGHSGVAKAGVSELPFVGAIARSLNYLFVQRRNSAGDQGASHRHRTQDPQAALSARVRAHPERVLVVAPEGTTKSADCLLQFRRGAFVPGIPVQPVIFRYRCRHFNVGWGVPCNDLFHVYRMLCQVVNHVEVEFLEVYVPSAEEKEDASVFAQRVRERMAGALGCGLVEESVREENVLREQGIRPNWRGTRLAGC